MKTRGVGRRVRRGMTLVEVVVSLAILGSVLISLAKFSMNMAHATSVSRIRTTASQLAADRVEAVKAVPRYAAIESLFVSSEASVAGFPGYSRTTMVTHVGGNPADTIDYRIVTVQVTNPQAAATVRKTTVIAPF